MKKRVKPVRVFFQKLPQLLLAGVIFSAIFAACVGVFAVISLLTGFNNVLVWGLGVIPATVFYAGLVVVIRKYAIENDFVPVVKTFFEAVRENWKVFLLHGVVTYLITACAFFAFMYYFIQAQTDFTFAYILSFYGLCTAALVIMMFYAPLMSATYILRWRDIYKNSLLLIFGKILRNLLTLLMVAAACVIALLVTVYAEGVWKIIVAVLIAAVYPMLLTYIIISMVSKGLMETVGDFVNPVPEEEPISVITDNTEDDYIFVNGKMIKNPNKKG
ncbi:MAG: DUF624 domain-containing protein [Ruminococcus sp.]|nr:DUF624 domain-containing protein [Ruminococcus sp.]